MKYCSPFSPFVLIGTHISMCTIFIGFVVEYSFYLNSILVCYPCRQCLHIVVVDFEISGISLIASFLLILNRLSEFMCPIILCQIQLSFSLPLQHLSFPISFNIYLLFGVLTIVATNFPDPSFVISHFFYSNIILCPWSHSWLTLSNLCFMFSTCRKFSFSKSLVSSFIVPFPIILAKLSKKNICSCHLSYVLNNHC